MDFETNPGGNGGNYFLKCMDIIAAKAIPDEFNDICLEVSFPLVTPRNGGESFSPKMEVKGKYKRDEAGNVIGLGSAFKVPRFFERLHIKTKFNSESGLPQEACDLLFGRKVWVVQYKAQGKDKTYYRYWEFVNDGDWTAGGDALVAEFEKTIASAYPPYKYAGDKPADSPGGAASPPVTATEGSF